MATSSYEGPSNWFASFKYGSETRYPYVSTGFTFVQGNPTSTATVHQETYIERIRYNGAADNKIKIDEVRFNGDGFGGLLVAAYKNGAVVDAYNIYDFVKGRHIEGGRPPEQNRVPDPDRPGDDEQDYTFTENPNKGGGFSYIITYQYTEIFTTSPFITHYYFKGFELNGGFIDLRGGVKILGGSSNDVLNGFDYDPYTKSYFNDTLIGGDGNDHLNGGQGYDLYFGGEGNDTFAGVSAEELAGGALNGGGGWDTVTLSDDIALSVLNLNAAASIEALYSYGAKNKLYGTAGNDIFDLSYLSTLGPSVELGDGADSYKGSLGKDRVDGGAGNDSLDGGAGHDSLDGGVGNDTLIGGAGRDTLIGGAGDDAAIYGGLFADHSIMSTTDGIDVRATASWETDRLIGIERLIFADGVYAVASGTFTQSAATPPIVVADAYTVAEDGSLSVAANGVLSNDGNPSASPVTAVLESAPQHGRLTLNPDGSFSYRPDADFTGVDAFAYRASNRHGTSAPATVTLTVSPVNDLPVADDESGSTYANTSVIFSRPILLAGDTDVDGDSLTVLSVGGAVNGTVALTAQGAVFTPTANFTGAASFTYTVSDGKGGLDTGLVSVSVVPAASTVYKRGTAGADVMDYSTATTKHLLVGMEGNDTLRGGRAADSLNAGDGNDLLSGGDGNDALTGGKGADRLAGGAGDDLFYFAKSDLDPAVIDRITDFQGAGVSGGDGLRFTGFGGSARLVQTSQASGTAYYEIVDLGGLTLGKLSISANGTPAILGSGDYVFLS